MERVKKYLKDNCDPQLPGVLSFGVKEAFRYLDELIDKNPIMNEPEFKKSFGHMRNSLVDIAIKFVLQKSSIDNRLILKNAKNNTNGYTHMIIEVKGAIVSSAKTRTIKHLPKKAIHRSEGSALNRQFNLFENNDDINENTPAYLLVTYGGRNYKLEYVGIGIPDVETEKWIDYMDIKNMPVLLTNLTSEESKNELELSFTKEAKKILGGNNNGEESV